MPSSVSRGQYADLMWDVIRPKCSRRMDGRFDIDLLMRLETTFHSRGNEFISFIMNSYSKNIVENEEHTK